jgi:hypothetical protein
MNEAAAAGGCGGSVSKDQQGRYNPGAKREQRK